jgi:uncharacterized protein
MFRSTSKKQLGYRIVALITLLYLGLQGFAYLVRKLNEAYWHYDFSGRTFWIVFFYLLQSLILLGFIVYMKHKYKWCWTDLGLRKFSVLDAFGLIFMAFVSYFAISLLLTLLLQHYGLTLPGFAPQSSYLTLFGNNPWGIVSLILTALVIAPLIEEILFRGYLLENLKVNWGTKSALFVSAAFFALFHFQLGSFFFLYLLGLLLGWIYLKSNSIWPCVIFHIVNNGLALLLEIYLLT